jgi:hypothetical protein
MQRSGPSARAQRIDAEPLGALVEWLDRFQSANIHSVLVVRGGALCFKHYRRGTINVGISPSPTLFIAHPRSTI